MISVIKARNCPEVWIKVLKEIWNNGIIFNVKRGSEISETKKIDVAIEITKPWERPLINPNSWRCSSFNMMSIFKREAKDAISKLPSGSVITLSPKIPKGEVWWFKHEIISHVPDRSLKIKTEHYSGREKISEKLIGPPFHFEWHRAERILKIEIENVTGNVDLTHLPAQEIFLHYRLSVVKIKKDKVKMMEKMIDELTKER